MRPPPPRKKHGLDPDGNIYRNKSWAQAEYHDNWGSGFLKLVANNFKQQ